MKAYTYDILFTFLFTLLIFGCFSFFDIFELLYTITREHEEWELDEIFLLLISIPIPLVWFAWRRVVQEKKQFEEIIRLENNLAHKQKMEALGVLASGMAHEINNQLQPVIAMSDLILSKMPKTEPNHRKIELIYAGACKAKSTVAKIKDFSHPKDESGQCEIFSACSEVQELVLATLPKFAHVSFEIENSSAWVGVSAENSHSLLVNLINNAFDALNSKPGEISIRVEHLNPHDSALSLDQSLLPVVQISVKDSGGGIEKKHLEKVFNPFFTTKKVGEGVGLGLSIVYATVNRAGGEVHIESVPGQGTTVIVKLPIVQSP